MSSETSQISEREREILCLVAMGATNQQIAYQLNISINTVKVHLRNIFGKIGVASRTEATLYAVRNGLVEIGQASTPVAAVAEPPPERIELPEPPSADDVVSVAPIGMDAAPDWVAEPVAPIVVPSPKPSTTRWRWLLGGGLLAVLLILGAIILFVNRALPVSPPISTPAAATAAGPDISSRWRELAPMPAGRSGFALASYNGDSNQYFYIIGGELNGTITNQLLRYEPGTNTWVQLTTKPTAVTDIQAAVIGNKVYVPGGRLESGAISDIFESYDPRRDKWSTLKPLPQKLSGYALAPFEGKLYLFGGWDGKNYHTEVWQYDPDLDTWIAKTPMQTARAFAGTAIPNQQGRIYVVGGENADGALAVNESYSPAEDDGSGRPWTTKTPLPAPASHIAAATSGRTIFVLGGNDATNQLLQYNIDLDSWKTGDIPLGPLHDLRAEAIIDKLYIIGGQNSGTFSDKAYEYQASYSVFLPLKP